MEIRFLLICATFATCFMVSSAQQIVAVLDGRRLHYNPHLQRVLTVRSATFSAFSDVTVVVETHNSSVATLQAVCDHVQGGADVLLDMSSPATGPLIRSFARAVGVVYLAVTDEALVSAADVSSPLFVQVQPPGGAMLNVVADMVRFENLTRVAILYDDSFDLHETPRRVISGLLSHHIYLDVTRGNLTDLLAILVHLEIESVFIIASSVNIGRVLGQANAHKDLNNDDINWFAITKDSAVRCDECSTRMRVVVASGDFILRHRNEYLDFLRRLTANPNYDSHDIKVDEAFAYDLSRLLVYKLPPGGHDTRSFNCFGDEALLNHSNTFNDQFIDNLKQELDYKGVFGPILTTGHSISQRVTLKLSRTTFFRGEPESVAKLGNWTNERGLNVSGSSLIREKSKKTYRVVVVPEYEPFIYKHSSGNDTSGRYSGFCWDLFQKIREHLDFEAEYYETMDGYFGSLNDDGSWNGAINELIEKRADIAVGPISVMSERENVVDFTVPFHEPVGLTILMKKHKFEYSLTKFLQVLDAEVWGVVFASFFLFSILMWLFDKFSPYSYQNNPSSSSGPEKRIFTLKESIWFCMTSLTPQGGGEAPKAISGRLVAAFWWLYGFLLIAFYTANLAAFLTVTRLETPISSLDDLSKQQSVKYGPMNGTSALVYFERMTLIEEDFYKIWKDMSLNDSLSPVARAKLAVWDYPVSEQFTKLMGRMKVVDSYSEALRLVARGEFAFIDDATRNKYQTLTDCDVEEIGEEFSRKPFAFAVAQGSPLRAQMSNVILELANNRVLEDLTNKWWDSNKEKKTCPRIEDESDGISINNIGGVFLVIAIGTVLSLVAFLLEYYYYKIKPSREARLYAVHRGRRPETGAGLDDVQVVENGALPQNYAEMDGMQKNGRQPSKRRRSSNNNNNNHHNLRGNGNSCKDKTRGDSNISSPAEHRKQNGHTVQNGGVVNKYFVFDTQETIPERYPDIYSSSSIETVFTERL